MQFRCVQCKALTDVEIPASGASAIAVACSGCGRRYRMAVKRPSNLADQERYRQAKSFSEENRIDQAAAYSVLEGLMTLDEARALQQKAVPGPSPSPVPARADAMPGSPAKAKPPMAERTASPLPASGSPARGADSGAKIATLAGAVTEPHHEDVYDPGFADAVVAGTLSVHQAIERGDRRALIARLAQRHRLPIRLATEVADNRISIRQALALKVEEENKEASPSQSEVSQGVWRLMVYSTCALILFGLGVHIYNAWGEYLAMRGAPAFAAAAHASVRPQATHVEPAPTPVPSPSLAMTKTDAVGQVVEITGPDPRSVLIGFCVTGWQSGRREPIEIAPAVPPHPALRFGIFRTLDQPGAPARSIRIREDPRTGRWVSGDGRGPIPTEVPPPQPSGTQTQRVDAPSESRSSGTPVSR